MALKFFVLAGVFILSRDVVVGASNAAAHAAPVLARLSEDTYDPLPQYTFGYDVQDALTGDSKNQVETRNGNVVVGQYSLNDPDGTRRIVDYASDSINGFNAIVRKAPLAIAAPIAEPVIAASRLAAPSLPVAAPAAVRLAAPALPVSAPAAVRLAAPALPLAAPAAVRLAAPSIQIAAPYSLPVAAAFRIAAPYSSSASFSTHLRFAAPVAAALPVVEPVVAKAAVIPLGEPAKAAAAPQTGVAEGPGVEIARSAAPLAKSAPAAAPAPLPSARTASASSSSSRTVQAPSSEAASKSSTSPGLTISGILTPLGYAW